MIHASMAFFLSVFLLNTIACGDQTKTSTKKSFEPEQPKKEPFKPERPPEEHSTPIMYISKPSVPEHSSVYPLTPERPDNCISMIALGKRTIQKDQCSGPYQLIDVEFYKIGKSALTIKLEGKVDNLPGDKTDRHTTVLYSKGGITIEDELKAKSQYLQWMYSRAHQGAISFYLRYWTGGKSELIEGELKKLVEYVREAFPNDKLPAPDRAKIHVALEK